MIQIMPTDSIDLRRRFCFKAAGVLALPAAAAALSGCAGLGFPLSMHFSESELNDLLTRQFPQTQRVAELVDVDVTSPRLWLIPDRNRVGASFQVSAAERLFGKGLQGHMALDSGLRFDAGEAALKLSQVRVQQFQVDAGGSSLPLSGQRIATLLAERLLEDLAIYRMKPEVADRMHALGFRNASIAIGGSGVDLTLQPG